jgi:glutamate carboxypeptidase
VRALQEASAKRILHCLREQEEAMAELLQRLALAESPSSAPRAQAGSLAILTEELESLDFAVKHLPGSDVGDHLEAEPLRTGNGGSRQLLLGHLDTVWPLGTVERMPVRLEDGRLKGPGVYDMKGGLVQMLFALRVLAELGFEPAVRPVVFVNSDEEIGSPGSATHIRRLARAAVRAYVLEPSFGTSGKLKTARKGAGLFRLRIKGRASHAGLSPEQGVSAILEASHQIQRLFELNDPERGVTVNVGTIDGGLRPNVVAPEVVADVDVRALREEDARQVERRPRTGSRSRWREGSAARRSSRRSATARSGRQRDGPRRSWTSRSRRRRSEGRRTGTSRAPTPLRSMGSGRWEQERTPRMSTLPCLRCPSARRCSRCSS